MEVNKYNFVKVEDKSYELNEFVTKQKNWIDFIDGQVLRSFEKTVRSVIEQSGKLCLKEKGFDVDADLKSIEEQRKAEQALLRGGKYELAPQYKPHTFTEQAARRNECRRLQRFVKLADYMIVSSLHSLTVDSARNLLAEAMKGCNDSDVAITERKENQDMDMENDEVHLNVENDLSGTQVSNVQVGGVTVGGAVKTSTLVSSGFEEFSGIMANISRRKLIDLSIEENAQNELAKEIGKELLSIEEIEEPVKEQEGEAQKATASAAKKSDSAPAEITEVKQQAPLFKTEVLLSTSGKKYLYVSPGLPEHLQAVDNLIKMFVSTVDNFKLVTGSIEYLAPSNMTGAYTSVRGLEEAEYTEGPSVRNIITEGGYFRELCGRIHGALVGMFGNTGKWMAQWNNVRDMYASNESFHGAKALEEVIYQTTKDLGERAGDYKAAIQLGIGLQVLANGNVDSPIIQFYRNNLAKFSEQIEIMTNIPATNVVNNVSIDTTKLKNVLLPSPSRCLSEVSKTLPGLARDKNEVLLNDVQNWVSTLSTPSSAVDSFVDYLNSLETSMLFIFLFTSMISLLKQSLITFFFIIVKTNLPIVEQQYEEITSFYNMMETYKIPIQPTDLAFYQTLGPTINRLKEAAEIASETKEENITKFAVDLEKLNTDLLSEIQDIRNRAQEPMVLNAGAKPDMVIQFLDNLIADTDRVNEAKMRYGLWTRLFKYGGSPTALAAAEAEGVVEESSPSIVQISSDYEETRNEVTLKRTLWTSMKEWETLTEYVFLL